MGRLLRFTVFLAAILGAHAAPSEAELQKYWAQWRGPLASGVAPKANPPTSWSETKNIRWKIELPGKGHSSPIVFGDRIFVMGATPVGDSRPPVFDDAPGTHDNVGVTRTNQFWVMAIDRRTGKSLWKKVVAEEFPHEGGHITGSLVNHSPVTDGENVYALFGSHGLFCFDLDGELKWQKKLGRMDTLHAHGEGSSPVVHGDSLIVCWDHEGDSFLYSFDKRTGQERWKTARDEKTAWATPLVVQNGDKWQIVTSATKRVRGYDFDTGALIWECAGLARNVVASPVAADGIVFAGNSYDFAAMLAIRLAGAKGDITHTTNVLWKLNRLTPYVPSPLLYEDLYFLRHNQNVLSRVDPATGRLRCEPIRLEGIRDFIFSSPVAAAKRIYITSRDGVTVVLSQDEKNTQLAINHLDDVFSASAALVDRDLILRGERFLYCVSEVN